MIDIVQKKLVHEREKISSANFNQDSTNILALQYEVGGPILILDPNSYEVVNKIEIEVDMSYFEEGSLQKLQFFYISEYHKGHMFLCGSYFSD